ncbi:MAG: MBOAT family O-acyltransferase [Spirochaetota bacterium]
MLFNSLHFLFFLPIVLFLFYKTEGKAQRVVLFLSSVYFYSVLKLAFLPLLFLSLLVTYYTSLRIESSSSVSKKKLWLFLCLLCNVGILVFFKYTDFLRSIYYDLIVQQEFTEQHKYNLVLPLGISFYTFQAIAYAVDVYRGVIPSEKRFFRFSLFLVFFPQLVAGPIIRAAVLIPQFFETHKFSKQQIFEGLEDVTTGIFKKTMIADPIAVVLKPLYSDPSAYSSSACFFASLLFSVQIYCDFAGYSDIAIGVGKMMGFKIPLNFQRPFLAASSMEIWQRWHISLSTWLRDYVYIPLGGSRVGRVRNYFNLFITMTVGGIWHGAAWTFIIWGLVHSFFQMTERFFKDMGWSWLFAKVPHFVRVLYAFWVFSFAAIFFRAESYKKAMIQISSFFYLTDGKELQVTASVLVPVFFLFIWEIAEEKAWTLPKENPLAQKWKLICMSTVLFLAFMIYTVTASPQFYYFVF